MAFPIYYAMAHMLQSLRNALILLSSLQNYDSLLHEQASHKYLKYPAAENINILT